MFRPVSRALSRPLRPALPVLPALRAPGVRAIHEKKDSGKLLDDDMLARAGLDPEKVEKPQGERAQQEEARAEDEAHPKWESTARAPRSESSQITRRRRRGWLATALSGLALAAYLARPLDEDERKQHPGVTQVGWELGGAWQRIRARYFTTMDSFQAPVFEKLLPDPLPPPYDRPTLVVSVDDLLVKSEWTRKYGWRVAKRPGVDYFLGYLAQYYEIVLFSNKYQAIAAETVLKLDPLRASVSYALFREATRYENGYLLKDLAHLNRDLKKVIVLDTDAEAVKLQPDNALILPPWDGKPGDADLVRLIPLLEWIGAQPMKDVRPVLKSYMASPDGVLNEFERRDQLNRKLWAEQHARSKSKPSLNSLLGIGKSSTADMMPQDVLRMESQKKYEQFRQHVEEYGKKMMAEEEQKMKDAMNEHKVTLGKLLAGEVPSPEELSATVAKQDQDQQPPQGQQPQK